MLTALLQRAIGALQCSHYAEGDHLMPERAALAKGGGSDEVSENYITGFDKFSKFDGGKMPVGWRLTFLCSPSNLSNFRATRTAAPLASNWRRW
jgi:hypothetical protein